MSKLGKFIAFKATIELVKQDGQSELLKEVYRDCLAQVDLPATEQVNHVKRLYDRYTDEQISKKIGELVYPKGIQWQGDLNIVFLPVEKMRAALPNNNGSWYFTGEYPTPGGYAMLNKAYINFFENKDGRAY